MSESGTTIENTNASTDTDNRYSICDRSGFRAKPGELKETWDGLMVLPQFWEARNEQDFIRSKAEKQRGALRPEPVNNPTFIDSDNPVTADDL